MPPPTDLDDALAFLQVMYTHVPSVTTYPVYLGDLDKVLAPFVTDDLSDHDLDVKLRRFWIGIDRMLPDAFAHVDLGPHDSRVTRSILRVERSLRQAVPNITLKVDPEVTPDDLIEDAVRTVFETGKPHFVNHPMMVPTTASGTPRSVATTRSRSVAVPTPSFASTSRKSRCSTAARPTTSWRPPCRATSS